MEITIMISPIKVLRTPCAIAFCKDVFWQDLAGESLLL